MNLELLTPLGLLGLLSIIVLIIIYIIRPNYQQKFVSTTFMWKLSLKYRKKRIPVSKLRNLIIILCQILILVSLAAILAQPAEVLKRNSENREVIAIIDSSASMRAEKDGETRFERAVSKASELINTTLGQQGTVSVIIADDKPEFIAQRVVSSTAYALYDELENLVDGDLACGYSSSDINSAITMCNDILADNPNAEIYLYSDAEYLNVPDEIEYVNVSNSEFNIAVLDAYTNVVDNYYEFTVDVVSYGRDCTIDVTVDVIGVNAYDKDDMSAGDMRLEYSVLCPDDQTQRIIFSSVAPEETTENVWYYTLMDSERVYSYQSVRISVSTIDMENDALEIDNSFELYNGQKEVFKVQYASALSNPFFNGALSVLRRRMSNRFDIQITEVKKGNAPALQGFNLYIFEHVMPATMPTDGIVILADPDKMPSNNRTVLGPVFTFPNTVPVPLEGEEPHELTKYMQPEYIQISSFTAVLSQPSYYTVLMSCQGHPVLLACNQGEEKVVIMSFSVHFSDAGVVPEFVTLLYNMFNYYTPTAVNGNAFEVNESVAITPRGESVTVTGSQGEETVIKTFPAEYKFPTPGKYTVSQYDDFGIEIEQSVYVNIPAAESNIRAVVDTLKAPDRLVDKSSYYRDLLVFVAAALVALLFIEWWLQSRENM